MKSDRNGKIRRIYKQMVLINFIADLIPNFIYLVWTLSLPLKNEGYKGKIVATVTKPLIDLKSYLDKRYDKLSNSRIELNK